MKFNKIFWLVINISLINFNLFCIFDRSLFYRVSGFWGEPRFEKPLLTTLDIQIAGGSTKHGRNNHGRKSGILSIYGPEDLKCFLKCPDSNLAHKPNQFSEISVINSEELFDHKLTDALCGKKFVFTGVLDVFEADFNYYQNFICGSFWHFHLPVVTLQIFPRNCTIFHKDVWTLNKILEKNDLCLKSVNEHGLSDSTLFLGWTKNYEQTIYLDFVDFTFQTGVLFPTGKQRNENLVFSIPLGYNGHWGIPWCVDLSFGGYDWITFGCHSDGVVFFDKTKCIRMRTEEKCTGLIRLKKDLAKIDSGTVWRVGGYIKSDHICWGLSFLLGFSFEQKNKSIIYPVDNQIFDFKIVNDDFRFKKWHRSICFLNVEYDFAREDNKYNGRIGLTYNHQISGKRTFNTDMIGGYYGFDVVWCF